MNHLLRELAPISGAGWELLDTEARERLRPALAARKLVDFTGPHGWSHSATNLGRTASVDQAPGDGVAGARRHVLPLAELRAQFTVSRSELAAADRGADDLDLGALDSAARRLATAENSAVFNGWDGVFNGIGQASPHEPRPIGDGYPKAVAGAVEALLEQGIAGPYGLALGPDGYRIVTGAAEHGGYPVYDHVRAILDGPIVWAPGVSDAIVVSLRGGDYIFECGQDIAVGYLSHDANEVHLYLEESFSFHAATPEAAVVLRHP